MKISTNTITDYMAKRFMYLLILLTMIIPNIAMAANQFVRAGATGLGTGNNWTDAYTQLPATLVRGNTYYIAAGKYPSYTVDDPVNGSYLITIKKATVSDHGCTSNCGWSDSYATGQAIFSKPFNIITSYIVFDGVEGSGSDSNSYGFKIQMYCDPNATQNQMIGIPPIGYSNLDISNVTVSHVAGTNCGPAYDQAQAFIYSLPLSASNMVVTHNYMSNSSSNMLIRTWKNSKISNNYFAGNWSSPANHGQQISAGGGCNDIELSNNIFYDSYVYVVGTHKDNNYRWNVFNNVVIGNGRTTAGFGAADTTSVSGVMRQWQVHHNTFGNTLFSGYGAIYVGYLSDPSTDESFAYNNLFFNCSDASIGSGIIHQYSAHYNSSGSYDSSEGGTATDTTGDPFINSTGGNYRLQSATMSGKTLSSPFNIDYDGNTRGKDGVWDRGAFEFNSNSSYTTKPNAPYNLSIN